MSASDREAIWTFVGKKDDIIRCKKTTTVVQGRDVLVIYREGVLYAIDSFCYHSGGPLQLGDIEDVNGKQCIVCPWHKYKITLAEGEGLYQSIDPRDPRSKAIWCSKGVKQRTHSVQERDGDVFVTLSDLSSKVESDYYQSKKYKQAMRATMKR
ncbi:Rieske domain-containing protein [Amia ocellicauda]|uniref:Rieske domain-containing protein n=1 Tax=Amia ocellicauda TaxID=2972642 RepID=UPI0034648863